MNKFILSLALLPAIAPLASANTLIDTTPGSGTIAPFGTGGSTATYGQTITVPTDNVLQSFSFGMDLPGSLQFKGYVYEWDSANGHATGPQLFSSPTTQTAGTGMEQITFAIPGGVSLTAGGQYVLFASISEIDGQSSLSGRWSHHNDGSIYAGGEFVFYNNGANESLWTSTTWDSFHSRNRLGIHR